MAPLPINLDDTIIILEAQSVDAQKICSWEHNRSRVLSTTEESGSVKRKHGSIIAPSAPPKGQIIWTFSIKINDPIQGFELGSDEDRCDVLLNKRPGGGGISRLHCRIYFNWDTGSLLLSDHSSTGTILESTFAGRVVLRGQEIPILDKDILQAGLVRFRLIIPPKEERSAQYIENLKKLHSDYDDALPRLDNIVLTLQSPKTYLDKHDLGMMEELGRGQSGTVFKAVDYRGEFYAVKIYNISRGPSSRGQEIEQAILREIEALANLEHEHIVSLAREKYVDDPNPSFVMEFAPMGTLEQHYDLSEDDVAVLARQVLTAIMYLHENGTTHRDVKPNNILVFSRTPLFVKLSDFGFASANLLTSYCGTIPYNAPEIVIDNHVYTNSVDIWSLGVIILELCHHCRKKDLPPPPKPFKSQAWRWRLIRSSVTNLRREPKNQTLLAEKMLNLNPGLRPTAKKCLEQLDDLTSKQSNGIDLQLAETFIRRSDSVTTLQLQQERTQWSEINFNGKTIPVIVSVYGVRQYIIKASTIYQALNRYWHANKVDSLRRIIVDKAPKGRDGIYLTLNDGIRLCRRLGDKYLGPAIQAFAMKNGVELEVIRTLSFSNLKQELGDIIQIDRFNDLPLAVDMNMLFRKYGLTHAHLKKHMPSIREDGHRTLGGQQGGTFTTVEKAIEILDQRALGMAEVMRKCYDRDLNGQSALTPQEAVSTENNMPQNLPSIEGVPDLRKSLLGGPAGANQLEQEDLLPLWDENFLEEYGDATTL